jgi:transposase
VIRETTRLVNRMKACLVRFGVRGFDPTLRKAADRLEKLITPERVRLPPLTLAEMLRDMARLRFLREQIRSIEKARVMRLKDDPTTRTNAMVHLIARIFGIGIETADTLVHEVLSRNLRDRRARCALCVYYLRVNDLDCHCAIGAERLSFAVKSAASCPFGGTQPAWC